MEIVLASRAKKQYFCLPEVLRRLVDKQLKYLLENPRHPSLNIKKYQGSIPGLWQARINQRYRFYFQVREDTYFVLVITDHPK